MRLRWMSMVAAVGMLLPLACGPKAKQAQKVTPEPPKPPAVPAYQPMAIDAQLRESAREQIEQAFTSNNAIIRANAIEAAQDGLGVGAEDLILSGLSDREPLVRFAAAMAAGRLQLSAARERLLSMTGESDPDVAIGVRFALHRLGDARLTHDLEKYARDPDPRVRGNTAIALGLLEEPTAIRVLSAMQKDPAPLVRWQVAEAMWRLGNESGLEMLVAGSVSQFSDDQMICTLALAGPRDSRVAEHIKGKLAYTRGSGWDEVSLVAARAMGMIGSDDGYGVALIGARNPDARQRLLAALALGAIGRSDAQPVLKQLIADKQQPVRLAAATAILQLKG